MHIPVDVDDWKVPKPFDGVTATYYTVRLAGKLQESQRAEVSMKV